MKEEIIKIKKDIEKLKASYTKTCNIGEHCYCIEIPEINFGNPPFRKEPAHFRCCNCGHKKVK